MILITGAAGKTGQEVLRALNQKGAHVRAWVHHPEQIPVVSSLGAEDSVAGDFKSPAVVEAAAQGVRSIYHICPNVSPDEITIAESLLKAAQAAGVNHFVYHSVLKPQIEAMPHHWKKLRVEEMLIDSGIPYTILQPAVYMQNILAYWESITTEGVYPIPYSPETRLSLVDLKDVAQVAALVLSEPGHDYAVYELAGTVGISQDQVAEVLSQALERTVQVAATPLKDWESQAVSAGMGKYQIQTLLSMFRYYQDHNFLGNPYTLSGLLGRPPTNLGTFVERTIRERTSLAALPQASG